MLYLWRGEYPFQNGHSLSGLIFLQTTQLACDKLVTYFLLSRYVRMAIRKPPKDISKAIIPMKIMMIS